MPAEPRVAILYRDGSRYDYGNYADARAAASSANRDTIIIYADLPNEQIVLKDNVDIWIYPGVIINHTDSGDTIIDNTSTYNEPVNCNIYGLGIIKNSVGNSCVKIINPDSKITMECDYIYGLGSVSVFAQAASKFHLTCNYVYNQYGQAIQIGKLDLSEKVDDINLSINKVETGDIAITSSGTTAVITLGDGFIDNK